ncbi:MAG: LPS export ABC transporter periplasmic protein LptC [Rickettsiales bacterium]
MSNTGNSYTKFVFLGKRTLPILAAGIILSVIWIASTNNSTNGGRMVFTNAPKIEEIENVMQKPRYQGINDNNQPYTIEADKATQQDKDNVLLDNIKADMSGDNNDWVAVLAKSGTINTVKEHIFLFNNVELFYEGGYQFRSKNTHIDLTKGYIYGNKPIEGNSEIGTIKADSFSISDKGNVINFKGSVKVNLYK